MEEIRLGTPRFTRLSPAQRRDAVSLLAALIQGTAFTSRDDRRAPRPAVRPRAPKIGDEIAVPVPVATPQNGKGGAPIAPGGPQEEGSDRAPDGLRGVVSSLTSYSARPGEGKR
jgi:hypothetical protein